MFQKQGFSTASLAGVAKIALKLREGRFEMDNRGRIIGISLTVGIVLGAVVGSIAGNVDLWIPIGVVLGIIVGVVASTVLPSQAAEA